MTYGQLVKCIPRYSLFVFGGLINIGLLIFLVLWTPYPTYVAVFLFVFFWGVADAVWNAMTASKLHHMGKAGLLVVVVLFCFVFRREAGWEEKGGAKGK